MEDEIVLCPVCDGTGVDPNLSYECVYCDAIGALNK